MWITLDRLASSRLVWRPIDWLQSLAKSPTKAWASRRHGPGQLPKTSSLGTESEFQ